MPNFKKSRGFSLRSGNKPSMSSFKMMGSKAVSPITSPANMNNFGIGKSASPLDFNPKGRTKEEIKAEQKRLGVTADGVWGPNSKAADKAADKAAEDNAAEDNAKNTDEGGDNGDGNDNNQQANINTDSSKNKGGSKFGDIMKKVGQVAIAAGTGGLDAVYGSGKIIPTGSARLIKKKKDNEKIETGDEAVGRILGMSSETVTKK